MADEAIEHRTYTDAATAQLGERVTNLGRRQSDLESEMRTGFKQLDSAVGALAAEMRSSVATLATNMAERNKPQWQAMAFALSFFTVVGGLVYWPIQANQNDMKIAMAAIVDKMVTRQEMDLRTVRAAEDRGRLDDNLQDIRSELVPRKELDRILQAIDQRFADQQRQLDQKRGGG